MIARAKAFLLEVRGIVGDETKVWAAEFQAALRELEHAAKVAGEVKKTGALNVKVPNGDQCAGGWTVSVNGGPERRMTGRTASFAGLAPDNYNLRVRGQVGGRETSAEKTFSVSAGAVVEAELELA